MATFDLSSPGGLRDACREAERRLVEDSEYVDRVETTAKFLREVHEASDEERQSDVFLHLIWDDNPLGDVGQGDYDLSKALSDDGFRQQFHDLISDPLPDTSSERARRLDEVFARTLTLVQRIVLPKRSGKHFRPIAKTARAFAALFPHDFTALFRRPIWKKRLKEALGVRGAEKITATAERRILDRLEAEIGPVDRSDWDSVARRMILPSTLLEMSNSTRSWPLILHQSIDESSHGSPNTSSPSRRPEHSSLSVTWWSRFILASGLELPDWFRVLMTDHPRPGV